MKAILKRSPVMPVITVDHVEDACRLATMLSEYGIHTLEITLRTANALDIINQLVASFPHMTVGAGTVNDIDTMEAVVQSKAHFVVSPGFSPALASLASMYSLPYLPGVASPSEVLQANAFGFDCLKLFPAQVVGGINWLKAMQPVFPDMSFCPTGGIGFANIAEYLALTNVLSVGMSALTPSHLIKQRNWSEVQAILDEQPLVSLLPTEPCVANS